jgi:hypothetical protein
MLDMLSNSSVCGPNLGKCLDNTGKYIDPSTGEAFLTVNLVNLANLISRPTGDQKWTAVGNNKTFVTFLNSKKKYLEPAMENCQDISDRVWDAFVEDALAQIKLAQDQKLEDMRQSCTSLTTQCLSTTATSISEFDARALSVFGVFADKTANEMCSSIKIACTALLESGVGDTNWVVGIAEIETDETYDTIVRTCREVGKACIIQTCKSISGNFGLCESIENSVNRKSIVNRTACWEEVVQCVQDAGDTSVTRIMEDKFNKEPGANTYNFYVENYGSLGIVTNDATSLCIPTSQSCVYDICDKCGDGVGKVSCATCRLAEKIWGNCEFIPSKDLATGQNKIKIPPKDTSVETLLSWFAKNTGTMDRNDSCKDTECAAGFAPVIDADGNKKCALISNLTSDRVECISTQQFNVVDDPKWTNCCPGNKKDYNGNCCQEIQPVSGFIPRANRYHYSSTHSSDYNMCVSSESSAVTLAAVFQGDTGGYYSDKTNVLVCVDGTISYKDIDANNGWPVGKTTECSGKWVVVNEAAGTYMSPDFTTGTTKPFYPNNYYNVESQTCVFDAKDKKWGILKNDGTWQDDSLNKCIQISGYPDYDKNNTFIKY